MTAGQSTDPGTRSTSQQPAAATIHVAVCTTTAVVNFLQLVAPITGHLCIMPAHNSSLITWPRSHNPDHLSLPCSQSPGSRRPLSSCPRHKFVDNAHDSRNPEGCAHTWGMGCLAPCLHFTTATTHCWHWFLQKPDRFLKTGFRLTTCFKKPGERCLLARQHLWSLTLQYEAYLSTKRVALVLVWVAEPPCIIAVEAGCLRMCRHEQAAHRQADQAELKHCM
ncbi:hypothetical protein COO60DRAFT_1515038 [Scenedesmus sp. NREL 46B-D3]|nr:hypothetical protein COO60DRAFT_1515038 [Scenedesmus sp. NREL 46B-D3]